MDPTLPEPHQMSPVVLPGAPDLLLLAAAQFRAANLTVWSLKDQLHAMTVRVHRAVRDGRRATQCLLLSKISVLKAVTGLYEEYAWQKAQQVTELEEQEWAGLQQDIENILRMELEEELEGVFDE